jgi:hypothetical protein
MAGPQGATFREEVGGFMLAPTEVITDWKAGGQVRSNTAAWAGGTGLVAHRGLQRGIRPTVDRGIHRVPEQTRAFRTILAVFW